MPIADLSGAVSNQQANIARNDANNRQNMAMVIGGIQQGAQDFNAQQQENQAKEGLRAWIKAKGGNGDVVDAGHDAAIAEVHRLDAEAGLKAKQAYEGHQAQTMAGMYGLNQPDVPAAPQTPGEPIDDTSMPGAPTPGRQFDASGLTPDIVGDYAKFKTTQSEAAKKRAYEQGPFSNEAERQIAIGTGTYTGKQNLDKSMGVGDFAPKKPVETPEEAAAKAAAVEAARLKAQKDMGAGDFAPKPYRPMTRDEQLAYDRERSQASAEGQNAGGGSAVSNQLKEIQLAIEKTKLGDYESPEMRDAKKIVDELSAIGRDVKRTAMYPGGSAKLQSDLAAAQSALGQAKAAPRAASAPAPTQAAPAATGGQSVNDVGATPDEMTKLSGNPKLMDAWNKGGPEYRKRALDAMRRGAGAK